MISTKDLSLLPDIDKLKSVMQSMAMLDAIIEPSWEYRYYSFDCKWDIRYSCGSMRNGSGDDYFAGFSPDGAIIKGFAHEARMSPYANSFRVWPGVLDEVPPAFLSFLADPSVRSDDTTFCVWRSYQDTSWQHGHIDFPESANADGSAELLSILDGDPHTYHQWAKTYYEQEISLGMVAYIYEHKPLTAEIVAQFNSQLSFDELTEDINQIGY